MGMSTHVVGIVPPDDEWQKNVAAFEACAAAGITPPNELYRKLGLDVGTTQLPDPLGLVISEYDDPALKAAISEWRDDMREGHTIDLELLPKRFKLVRVYNSW